MNATGRCVDPRIDPAWRELASGTGGSLFTAPPWIDAMCATYGFTPTAWVAVDGDGRPRAGVAWVDVCDLRGQRRVSVPFSDRADPVILDAQLCPAVAAELMRGELPVTVRCRETSALAADPRFATVAEATLHETALDRPLEALHSALRPATRRNIAAARRAGVEVVLRADADAVVEYHRLHVDLRRSKYRLLAQPVGFFERLWEHFSPSGSIVTALAMVDGRSVAGAVYLRWQDTLYYKFGASLSEFLPARPNDALHWHSIRWAVQQGFATLDWGTSDLDQPGLIAYKRGWASTESRILTLRAGGSAHGGWPDAEGLLTSLTELLTDPLVPPSVTARAGGVLYRYFC